MKKLKFFCRLFLIANLYSGPADASDHDLSVEDPEKLVLKVTEQGFDPGTLVFHKEDASVFVVNSSKSSLMTLSIDFKGKKAHCASGNLGFDDKGVLKSNSPIAPKDFAVFCIPERGKYELFAYGLGKKPMQASLEVE